MKETEIQFNPNKLIRFLNKPAEEFTKDDIMKFIIENNIEMINFRYAGGDGKLKTLNFVITSKSHLESILTTGERVDGSSLFSFIEAGSSDLYVIPRFETAYLNPFAQVPTVDIFCSFFNSNGEPLASSPENILVKADKFFTEKTGYKFKALAELEYYVISDINNLYPTSDQKGYHDSHPFTKWEHLRIEAMRLIAQCGGKIKYSHSEVGCFNTENQYFEQHEIEFLPTSVIEAADMVMLSKWILRMLGDKYGVTITFAPKISVGKAGNGMHIHMLLQKDGKNVMSENGKLSDIAKKMIAGILDVAGALTAFGNTVPTSYLRLVPHQEAPTTVCWGDRNRSVLIRVPLGWLQNADGMISIANPQQPKPESTPNSKQTVEFRAPDGSADIYMLLAGLVVAAQHGLEMKNSLQLADMLYVDYNIHAEENKAKVVDFANLPESCWESAEMLNDHILLFEKNNVFPRGTILEVIKKLKSYHDIDLSERLYGKNNEIKTLVDRYLHTR